MTDPQTGSELVTVNLPGGDERHLKKLSPLEWIQLGNTLKLLRKTQHRAELLAVDTPADDVRKSLDAFDRRPVRYADVEQFADSLEGQYYVLRIAFGRDGKGEDDIDSAIAGLGTPGKWLRVVAALLDLKVVTEPANPPAGDGQASNPPPPPTSTGGDSPTESPSGSTPSPTL